MTDPAIEILNLGKAFGSGRKKNQAVVNLSLCVPQGDVFGFLGPTGAGKSTTIKLLLHFLRPDTGSLRIMGHVVGNPATFSPVEWRGPRCNESVHSSAA